MRVLVLTNLYPPHHYGGYELACAATVRRWRRAGHDVHVATGDHNRPGVDVGYEPWVTPGLTFYWRDHELIRPNPAHRLVRELRNRRLWRSILDRHRPDVVSVWNFGTMSYHLLAEIERRRIPLALVVADNWLRWGPRYDLWTRMFESSTSRRAVGRAVTSITRLPTRYPSLSSATSAMFASDWLDSEAQTHSRFPLPDRRVIPWGVDTSVVPVVTARSDDWTRGRILFVGRLDRRKGLHTVIRAIEQLPGYTTLHVVGPSDGGERAGIDELITRLGLGDRVTFESVGAGEVSARYRTAEVAVFPSEWEEPFGLVGLEAMASATPLVATGTGGSGTYLRDGENAVLYPAGDVDALVGRLTDLLDNRPLQSRLVENGLDTARRFTLERMADELEAAHLDLVSSS